MRSSRAGHSMRRPCSCHVRRAASRSFRAPMTARTNTARASCTLLYALCASTPATHTRVGKATCSPNPSACRRDGAYPPDQRDTGGDCSAGRARRRSWVARVAGAGGCTLAATAAAPAGPGRRCRRYYCGSLIIRGRLRPRGRAACVRAASTPRARAASPPAATWVGTGCGATRSACAARSPGASPDGDAQHDRHHHKRKDGAQVGCVVCACQQSGDEALQGGRRALHPDPCTHASATAACCACQREGATR